MNNEGYQITYTGEEVQELLDKAGTAVQTETDPTVPSWAKAEEKPSYSASEVGAVPTTRKVNNKALSADVTLSASDVGALSSDTPLFSGSYDDLTNKPSIPDSLSDLSDDSTHRVVTDTEKSTWSAKSDFSGSYDDLTDKPTIPAAQVQSDWSEADDTKVDYIKNKPSLATVATSGSYSDLSNKPTIPDAQVQTDWNESDNTKVDYIKNKPTLGVGSSSGAASSSTVIGIPAGGNAGQVLYKVDGSTDYSVGWTNQTQNYPSAYCTTAAGTAAKKASCTLYAAQANSYLHVLIGSSNTSASALTLNVNSEGAKPIYINGTASSSTNYTLPKGTYIVFYDGTNYYFRTDGKIQAPNGTLVQTNSTAGLLKNDGTVDTTTYISDVSGKADKSEMSVTTSGDQTTVTLKSGTSATVINQHQSLSGYVQTSSTTGLIKNDGTIDTTSYGTYSKPAGGIPASDIASGVIPDVSGKENTSNKVTSLSSSSTDTQYPSAKCVYDLVGDIETILASI